MEMNHQVMMVELLWEKYSQKEFPPFGAHFLSCCFEALRWQLSCESRSASRDSLGFPPSSDVGICLPCKCFSRYYSH